VIIEGSQITADVERSCDVCIIGSGAGGAVVAARLAAAGLDVVVLEEGGNRGRADFVRPNERWSYPELYQDRGGRATDDVGITVLQGRTVGGSTVVNWTTCFRTPERILDHWRREHGVELDAETLRPHFEAVEQRLSIQPWAVPPNPNNDVLRRGCAALGWEHEVLRRNVKGCANSGFCGLGCPVDGKQAMQITYLADAITQGATLYSDVRVERLELGASKLTAVHGVVMERGSSRATSTRVVIRPRITVSSCGALNGPALFLRSGLDGLGRVGKRTFFHPVVAVLGEYEQPINPFYGAPQSVSSHEFIERGPDEYGFFMESAPMQPMLAASAGWVFGAGLDDLMLRLPHVSAIIALQVDGVLPGDEGGVVGLRSDGRMSIHYPVRGRMVDGMRDAHLALARIHLAAGAKRVMTTHATPLELRTEADLPKLEGATFGTHEHSIFTAHQMGGLAMGADPSRHPVDLDLRFRGVDNLFVVDGSVLPTALGVNPSETIYGIAHWAADKIVSMA